MDNRLQTLERALSSSPTDCAAFLRFIHHHTRISGLLTPAELTKVHELLDTGDWLPGTVNKFGRIELIHAQTEMVFVVLPTGTYTMGDKDGDEDEQPAHKVAIDDVHLMGKYPVTQGQWRKIMGSNPSTFSNENKNEKKGESDYDWDNHPVETVSWLDCQDFMKKTGLRLPPENGWEYACRAGTTERFHAAANDDPSMGGDDEDHLQKIAVFGRDYEDGHAAVGTKQPNSWGIHDMLGNVWDWCQDKYHDSYIGAPPDCRPWNGSWDTLRQKLLDIAVNRGLLSGVEKDELLQEEAYNACDTLDDLLKKADAAILTLLDEVKTGLGKKLKAQVGLSSEAQDTQGVSLRNGMALEEGQGHLGSQATASTITTTGSLLDQGGGSDPRPLSSGGLDSISPPNGNRSSASLDTPSSLIIHAHGIKETTPDLELGSESCPDFTMIPSGEAGVNSPGTMNAPNGPNISGITESDEEDMTLTMTPSGTLGSGYGEGEGSGSTNRVRGRISWGPNPNAVYKWFKHFVRDVRIGLRSYI